MPDYSLIERQLSEMLGLQRRPVAVAFRSTPPTGVEKFAGTEPSSCSFWRIAARGRTFYTVPSDHYNCPIGSYTHNIALPPERAPELDQTLSLMATIGYIRAFLAWPSPRESWSTPLSGTCRWIPTWCSSRAGRGA